MKDSDGNPKAGDSEPLPSQEALERFAKPLPDKRKPLRRGGTEDEPGNKEETEQATELPAAKPKERLRPPGEVPDRLNFDGEPSAERPEKNSEFLEDLRAKLDDRDADGKAFPPISQDFQTAHNEAMSAKERGELRREGQRGELNLDRDRNLPPLVTDTLWNVRNKIGLILAFCAIAAGVVASFQFGKAPEEKLLAPTFSKDDLIGPREIVEQFLDPTSTLEERVALVRGNLDPAEVEAHFVEFQEDLESEFEMEPIGQSQMLDVGYHKFRVDFEIGRIRYVFVVEEPEGFKIDWEIFANAGESDWNELLTGEEPTADLRVHVRPGAYYNYAFFDKANYSAFVIISPTGDHLDLFGYARRGSLTERILHQTLILAQRSKGSLIVPMKLRLVSANGSHEHRQFLVSHVVSSTWIESKMGTLEELWAVSRSEEPISLDGMTETAAMFEAPLMFKQGLNIQTEDLDAAARYFRNALEFRSDFLEARVSLGAVLAEQNRLDEAEAEFRAVLEEDPTYAETHYQLGICALKRGNYQRALEWFESTVTHDPWHELGLNNMAWLLATHEDESVRTQARVVHFAKRAVQVNDGSNPSILSTLGVAHAAAGDFEEAAAATKQAVRLLQQSKADPALEAKLKERAKLFENGERIHSGWPEVE